MRTKIVNEALSWVDTPYHHRAKVKGVGVDCAMLVLCVAYNCDLVSEEQIVNSPKYNVQWHIHNTEEKLIDILKDYGCVEIPISDIAPGDIVAFQYGRVTSHLGIVTGETQFVHARMDIGRVVLNTLNMEFTDRLTHAYRFPGVE